MSREEIIEIINGFLVDEFEVEEEIIVHNANMQETLGLDSLDYVDLFALIETHFGIKLNSEDFQKIGSFNDLYNHIVGKLQAVA